MRVLQILSSTGFHGAESMAAELSKQLAALGADVDVAVLDNAGKGNDDIFSVVGASASATYRIPCARQFDPHTLWALSRKLTERRIDVVHSHCYKTTFYAGLLRPWRNIRLVSTYHNWLTHTRALRVYAAIDKNLSRLNDIGVGVSTPVVRELRRYMSASKVSQIDNGIDVDRFVPSDTQAAAKQALGLDVSRQLVGFVGRLSPEKGLQYLLPALASPELQQLDLVIAGDGPERERIESTIRELGLTARVHMLGYRRDTSAIYAALDAFVLPSTIEAFPMVLLEAMSSGLPVIATRVGEVPRMVRDKITGWLVDPAQSEQLKDALQDALVSTDNARRVGLAAREQVVSQFSSRAMARQYLDLYEKACAR